MQTYTCSICGREVPRSPEPGLPSLYPFCSERCRLVDLGKWFRGDYAIERDLTPEDAGEVPDQDDAPRR